MVDLNMKVKTINLLEENRIFWGLQIYFASIPNTDHKTKKMINLTILKVRVFLH